jgi:hypothetical protein
MTKRKKQAIILLALSVPMLWFGFTNFMSDTTSSNALGMMIAISITFGGLFGISSLIMLATKNSLGIWDIDDKEKGRGDGLLASQTKVEDPPIQKEVIKQPTKKVNKMAKTTSTSVEMMKREKELEARRKELEGLLEEVRHEETKLEQSLQEKGWVKKDGDWGIE